jgi:hypothetical protein
MAISFEYLNIMWQKALKRKATKEVRKQQRREKKLN